MPSTSFRLALPYLQPSQAQKHVTHNEALQLLDAIVQLRVLSFAVTTPPATPAPGDVYDVGPLATGAWTGQDGRLALWDGTGWQFLLPREGWRAWNPLSQTMRVHAGGAWAALAPAPQNVAGVGVNTTSNATNRLAVSSAATLLSHEGADHRVKVNKAGTSDTASLVFQSNFTGHAEMGLAGGLDFALKVSDGTAWSDALSVARATGRVTLPQGAVVNGTLTGTAVQASATDATPGRILVAGAYGLGGLLPPIGNAGVVDAGLVPGLYAYDTALGSSGGPAGATRGALLHARRAATAGETQTFVVEAGTGGAVAGATFSRSRASGAWTAWLSGSVTENATNANGEFVRYACGVQDCWSPAWTLDATTANGTLFRSAVQAWTFPAAFVAAPCVSPGGTNNVSLCWATARAVTATAGEGCIISVSSLTARSLRLRAVGRWY